MQSTQTLSEDDRRVVARWAAACAGRVIGLFTANEVATEQVNDALARAKAYSAGQSTSAEEIRRRLVAVKAAGAADTSAGAAAARAVGQAAAVAHMGAHAFGAAAYAVKAVSLAHPDRPELVDDEIRWQLTELTAAERSALRALPMLGTDTSGPLGPGLLAGGILGDVIRRLQASIAED